MTTERTVWINRPGVSKKWVPSSSSGSDRRRRWCRRVASLIQSNARNVIRGWNPLAIQTTNNLSKGSAGFLCYCKCPDSLTCIVWGYVVIIYLCLWSSGGFGVFIFFGGGEELGWRHFHLRGHTTNTFELKYRVCNHLYKLTVCGWRWYYAGGTHCWLFWRRLA